MLPFQRASHTLFFAYGGNMVPEQIQARCTKPEVVSLARLPGHRVAFFGYSKVWDGAVETVVPAVDHEVWGVLYRLTISDSNRLDSWQDVRLDGTGSYFHYPTEVIGDEGTRYSVLMYKKDTQADPLAPSRPYLERIVSGARLRNLPGAYVETLARIPTKEPGYEVPKRGTFDRSLLADMACSDCG